jgi:hypothetical protein
MSLFDEDDGFPESEPMDDGMDRRRKKGTGNPEAKAAKKIKKTTKNALTPQRMFFKKEERDMYAEYFNRFKSDVEEAYGSFSTAQEVLVDTLCLAIVRMERKSRLESHFGRFFDRVATQDPLGQINQTLKNLGLLPEKKGAKEAAVSASNSLKNSLAADSLEAEQNDVQLNYEEWAKSRESAQYEVRTPEELPNYTDVDLIFESENDAEESAEEEAS